MSKESDQGKAERLGPFRNGKRSKIIAVGNDKQSMVRLKCVYPPCTVPVLVKPPPPGVKEGSPQHMATLGGIPMCTKHAEMLGFHIWCITNIKFEAQRTAGGLVLPGNEKFNATVKQEGVPK